MSIKTCARQRSGKAKCCSLCSHQAVAHISGGYKLGIKGGSLPGRGYVVLTPEEMLHG